MQGSMEGEGQQFCLRWHNFQNTLLSSLPKLLDGGYLADVTLSAGGRHIRAHRIILSASSYYFKELFKDLSTLHHPVIVLPGMEYVNLCALVTFMYNGEVNIYQEQLPALLAMADTLHIRGLADIAGKNTPHQHDNGLFIHPTSCNINEEQQFNESIIKTESNKTDSIEQNSQTEDDNDDSGTLNTDDVVCSVKTKPYYSINAKLVQKERKLAKETVISSNNSTTKQVENKNFIERIDDVPINNENPTMREDTKISGIADGNLRIFGMNTGARGGQTCNKTSVTCLICGKQLSNQYNLRVHMETHSNCSYSCSACSHVSRSRDALRKHVSYRHPVATPQKRPRYGLGKL